jgi:hypothetical protein
VKQDTAVRIVVLVLIGVVGAYGAAGVVAAPEDGFVIGQGSGDSADIPSLTAAEEQSALTTVGQDPWLATFLGGQAYTVLDVGPWSNDVAGTMGAIVEIAWPLAISKAEAYYPDVSDYMDGKEIQTLSMRCVDMYCPPYRPGTVRYAISGATTMLLQVDLTSNTVVHAQVGPEATFVPAANEPAEIEEHD